MKKLLQTVIRSFSEIENRIQRDFIQDVAELLCMYARSYRLSTESILIQQNYIEMLFLFANFLYSKDYELGKIYFELLNLAATQLEKLSREQIAKLSDGEEIAKVNNSLGEYFDKVAMIFQAAADNTEDELYQKTYSLEAENYSKQADAVRGIFRIQTHTQKMFVLYTKAAQTCEMPFIREVLEERAAEYLGKLEAEKFSARRSVAANADSESDPLLHHRHPHQSGEENSLESLFACRQ